MRIKASNTSRHKETESQIENALVKIETQMDMLLGSMGKSPYFYGIFLEIPINNELLGK